GSTLTGPQRLTAAMEVTTAVLELDNRSRDPLFVLRANRDGSRMAVAYAPEDGSGLTLDEAETHLDAVMHFGNIVDALLEDSELITAPRLREELLADAPSLRLPDARVTQLAVGLSSRGRLSSMGEVYRSDLDSHRAVELALRGAPTRELAV